MANISVWNVATEGFRLIRQRPLAVLVWGFLAFAAQSLLPTVLIFAVLLSPGGGFRAAFGSEAALSPSAVAALQLQASLIQWLTMPLSIFASTVVSAAVLRSVLQPENFSRFSLRVGKTEGAMFLVALAMIALTVLFFIPVCGLILVAMGILGFGSTTAWVVGLLLGIAAFVGYIWLALRLYMALPLTFAEGRFRLFESWGFTKGHVRLIVGVYFAQLAIMLAFFMLVVIVMLVLAIPMTLLSMPLFALLGEASNPPFDHMGVPALVALGVAAFLLWSLLSSICSGAFMAIVGAPGARIFQIIRAGADIAPPAPSPEPAAA